MQYFVSKPHGCSVDLLYSLSLENYSWVALCQEEEKMRDQTKNRLSVLAYFSMFVLPPVGFLIGWIGWNIRMGIVTDLILFTVFFLLGGLFLAFVENSSWFSVSLPLIGSTIYTIMPDLLPGPIDDTIVMTAGSLLTFALWLRKQPEAPKWIIFPLLMASLYTLVGSFIPGPVDELFVTAIASGTSIYGAFRSGQQSLQISSDESGNNLTL